MAEVLKEAAGEKNIEAEVRKLKMKTNMLLDLIDQMKKEKMELIREKELLKQENERLGNLYGENVEAVTSILTAMDLLKEIQEKSCWVSYKNDTALSKEYLRVEKTVVDGYLEGMSEKRKNDFILFLKNVGIIRSEGNKMVYSSIVDGYNKRLYMFSRSAVKALLGDG